MSAVRRVGAETSKTRSVLLDVAEEIMLEEGYAAVTSRRLAAKAGVKPPLVYYYFPTLDDLFVAVYRRRSEHNFKLLRQAMDAGKPLWGIWSFNGDRTGTALAAEFVALANHRKAIQVELADSAEQLRQLQIAALERAMGDRGAGDTQIPAAAAVVTMVAVQRIIVIEEALGMSGGHAATREWIETVLERLEGPVPEALLKLTDSIRR